MRTPELRIDVHVDDVAEIANVAVEVVVPMRRGCAQRLLVRNALYAGESSPP